MSDEDENPENSREVEFPFSDWQLAVEAAAERLSGRVRNCGRSAFVHLRKAWQLHGLDDEMSAFRAITAEEEAATALIQALKSRQYPGSKRLRPWNHNDKNAFWPLIVAVNDVMVQSGMPTPNVALSRKGKPRVELRINLTALAGREGDPVWAAPDQPLNFAIRTGQADDQIIHLFETELADLAATTGEKSILEHIKKAANLRNLVLYASDDGIPNVTFQDDMLRERARRVGILVILAIIVMQTPAHQLFVRQCLEALLRALEVADEQLVDAAELVAPREQSVLTIDRVGGGPGRVSISRSIDVRGIWLGIAPIGRWPKPGSVRVTFDALEGD